MLCLQIATLVPELNTGIDWMDIIYPDIRISGYERERGTRTNENERERRRMNERTQRF